MADPDSVAARLEELTALSNCSPYQRTVGREVRREAYRRHPMTCDTVRQILDGMLCELQAELNIPDYEIASLDVIISRAFVQIRDKVTHPFRDEQMRLLQEMLVGCETNEGLMVSIDSKKYRLRSAIGGGYSIEDRSTGESRYVAKIPNISQLLVMHERNFDAEMEKHFKTARW